MSHPLLIAGVGVLTVRQPDENVWGKTKLDRKHGGVRHLEFTLEPQQPARWSYIEEDDTFVDSESDDTGTSSGIAICEANPAQTPESLRQALARASINMDVRISYHTTSGMVIICLDFQTPVRISQEIVDRLASRLGLGM